MNNETAFYYAKRLQYFCKVDMASHCKSCPFSTFVEDIGRNYCKLGYPNAAWMDMREEGKDDGMERL